MKKILLLGKGGQVGWELQRSLSVLGEVTALDFDSTEHCGDFSNPEGVAATVRALAPDVIVNAAAHTAVDKAESEPDFARKLNATTPGLIAQEAARYRGQEREVQKFFAENAVAAAQLRAPLFEEKVVDWLLGKAAITDRAVSRADLEAAIESEDETPLSAALPHGAPGHVHGPDCDHDHGHDVKPKKAPELSGVKSRCGVSTA